MRRKIPCYATSKDAFESLAEKENPQGILAVARIPVRRLREYTPENFPWGAAVIAPQDPGNVGAILRTIDAVGADGLILIDESVDAFHPTAVRASLGSIFRRPVIPVTFSEFSQWAAEYGYHIYGSSAHAALDYRQANLYRRPLILLMGSERKGLSQEQTSMCEAVVRIPMRGKVTSLNLAVAAGILLYAIMHQLEQST
jgi:TrmH family RNA methyltransferase